MKKNKSEIFIYGVFALVGIIILLVGICTVISSIVYEIAGIEMMDFSGNPGGVLISGIFSLLFGAVFAAIGVIPIIVMIRKDKKKEFLLQQGRCIYATVDNVDLNHGYRVNGRSPYLVYCSYTDEYTGVIYKFKSENLWTDPYPYIQQGNEIRVFVDGQDYSQHYVDVESSFQGKIVDYT